MNHNFNEPIQPLLTPLAHRVTQAGARIGLGRTSTFGLIKAGELRTIKVGARRLITETELQRFLAQRMGA